MRQGEVLWMRWRNVHGRYVHLPRTKNGEQRNVPLSSRALALLGCLTAGKGDERVTPLEAGTSGAYFREAVRGAAISDLHFHDARHEAITRFAQRLSIMELARVSGHRDTRMLLGYYHPDAGDLAAKLD
jgi:integrase